MNFSAALEHLMAEVGNAGLITAGLCQTLCDYAMGNYRVLLESPKNSIVKGAKNAHS
jgi:hypothetical protein